VAEAVTDSACPRCGGGFHCGVNDTAPCACMSLQLDPALTAELRQRYTGCLCLACLRTLNAEREKAGGSFEPPAP
jgi:hypothetical protein